MEGLDGSLGLDWNGREGGEWILFLRTPHFSLCRVSSLMCSWFVGSMGITVKGPIVEVVIVEVIAVSCILCLLESKLSVEEREGNPKECSMI